MGRGLAKMLAQRGANVVIVARNKENLAKGLEYIAVGLSALFQLSHIRLTLPAGCRN